MFTSRNGNLRVGAGVYGRRRVVRHAVWAGVLAAVCSCSVPPQFYADSYSALDGVYENRALGFALMYPADWRIMASPRDMDRIRRRVAAELHRHGAELLFAGETLERSQGTRAIAENLNRTNEQYLDAVRNANVFSIEKDLGAALFLGGSVPMLKWEYVYSGNRYVEFLFRAGTHNVRIAFWTTPERYEAFLPVYEKIMQTLSVQPYP